MRMDSLVSTEWLADRLGAPDLVVIDASAHLPTANRDARAAFTWAHIPGARFLDLATLIDRASSVPSAVPTGEQLAARMAALGVSSAHRIVIYDDSDVKTSARAWFILRMHGAKRVAILDGGLPKWRAEGRPLDSGETSFDAGDFTPSTGLGTVRLKHEMVANLDTHAEQVVDARGAARFSGEEPDFRADIPSGHIPGSRNLPFARVLNEDGTFRSHSEIRAAFEQAGIDLDQPVVTTCGGGVTAAVLLFALHLIGKENVALYDGSWSEWAADPATPKATGRDGERNVE